MSRRPPDRQSTGAGGGPDTADDVATCPRLADGLSGALGARMSYWTGTLPNGPVGCTWAPVPLQYGTIDYPFTASVGFLADGSTAEQAVRSQLTVVADHPEPCPWAPASGGALAECSAAGDTSLVLAVPDRRGPGTWVLIATAGDDSGVDVADVLTALVDGVTRAYG